MILLIVVGSIFFLFGLGLYWVCRHFDRHAREVRGHVVALEKRVSHSSSSSSNSSSVLWIPIVEYTFNGELVRFSPQGGSSMGLQHFQIGKPIKLLSLDSGPEYVMLKKSTAKTMALIFLSIGALILGIGLWNLPELLRSFKVSGSLFDFVFHFLPLFMVIPFFFVTGRKISKFIKSNPGYFEEHIFKMAKIETSETLEHREIYWSEADLKKIKASHARIGFWVTMAFGLISLGGANSLFFKMPKQIKKDLYESLHTFDFQVVINHLRNGEAELIGFLFMGFLFFLCLYSLWKQKIQN